MQLMPHKFSSNRWISLWKQGGISCGSK